MVHKDSFAEVECLIGIIQEIYMEIIISVAASAASCC
jgi:hypothetical protein